jgi:hypothetical protein
MTKIRISHPDGYTAVKLTDETAEGEDVKTIDYTPDDSPTRWTIIRHGDFYTSSGTPLASEEEGFLAGEGYVMGCVHASNHTRAVLQFQLLIAACKKVTPLE